MILVRTEAGATGLEIVKEASTDADLARLRRETTMLRRAAHPGVVEIIADAPGELRLTHHGTPLAMLMPLPIDRATPFLRVVAETLADLHGVGITHGRVSADHVLIDERDRPRLCGFADAGEATDDARAADVAGLGRLLDQLLDTGAELPWARLGGWRRRTHRRHGIRRLRAAATAAQHPEPSRRPTARQFSAAIHDALPASRLEPRRAEGGWTDADLALLAASAPEEDDVPQVQPPLPAVEIEPSSPSQVHRRVLVVVAVLVLVAGVVVGSTIARTIRPFGPDPLDDATATARAPQPERHGSHPDPHAGACPDALPSGPDIDDDGCGDPVTLRDRIASIGDLRIELGRPGDLAVVADSDCDGVATPVLLRPSTGEVFVFDEWTTDEETTVSASAVVPGAGAIAMDDGRCPSVTVTGLGIRRVVVGSGA